MDGAEREEIPMLLLRQSHPYDEHMDVLPQTRAIRTRSASMSSPYSIDSEESENHFVSHTGPLQSGRRAPSTQMSTRKSGNLVWPEMPLKSHTSVRVEEEFPSLDGTDEAALRDHNLAGKNEHLLRSGQLGRCNDPYCTTCPIYYNYKPAQKEKISSRFESKFHNILSTEAKGWMRRSLSFLGSHVPGIMNPHATFVQRWNKFFVISCLVAIFVDPLFFFLLSVEKDHKCIYLNWPMATSIAVVRSITDFVYLLHMLLQFRLAYVAPESRVVGAGELVDEPKKIALHYLYGYFSIDVFVVLPLPQIMILFVLPTYIGSSSANYAKNLLRATVLLQYIPRFCRFLPLLTGRSASGFIFETAWANFVINLLIFVLAGHVVGSCWYLFGLQRVNQCLRNACASSQLGCKDFIDCGRGDSVDKFEGNARWELWKNNTNASDCLTTDGLFNYGIYVQAVRITTLPSIVTRYIYSLFWGFQQISTLAGNQVPSDFVWEVLFTMGIVGLGLFLFALLIGNMQNFLQALGRRRLEMQLRNRDVEQWMSYRRLPDELRRQVRQSERFHWAATRGVNEEMLLENLPEDLQRDIRRHLFSFIKKIRIFGLMGDPILDAICERLRQTLYIKDSKIIYRGGVVDKIIFIVRGKMVSVDADGNAAPLSEGDICGEELLTWSLDHSPVHKDGKKVRATGQRVLSNRTVTCLTNVEAFSLRATDLEEVTALFPRFFRSSRVQGAIRYESPFWRGLAATRIQVAWKYRRKRLSRGITSNHES